MTNAIPPDETSQEDIANRLHSVAIHLLRHIRQVDALTDVSPARLSVLSVVGFAGPRSISELAAAEQVTLPTMSRLVAALEQDKLVAREADADDGRIVHIAITQKGMGILQEGRTRRVALIEELFQQLTPDELQTIHKAVGILEGVLDNPK